MHMSKEVLVYLHIDDKLMTKMIKMMMTMITKAKEDICLHFQTGRGSWCI